MFGGLTRTSSRIAIAATFGLVLGGYALSAAPAKAADFGGDCCADLEERVAELEATTVRKGNKKVSVTLSGWVVKTINFWDDGENSDMWVGDKDADLTSRFAITGSAQISPGWSGGFNITVTVPGNFGPEVVNGGDGNVFGILSTQADQDSQILSGINTLYSYIYIKSDHWGTINWGYLSPASDNPAVLADISGTVIESNAVFFEGPGFIIPGLTLAWSNFLTCLTGIGPIGADCFGAPQNGIRYDSPTWGGLRFEASTGNYVGTNTDFYDVAVIYNGDWNSIKVSAAYAFTHLDPKFFGGGVGNNNALVYETDVHQVGATIMHTPSGLGIYGLYQHEDADIVSPVNDNDVWYIKPFWKKTWHPLGATIFYGEYGEYDDQCSVGNCTKSKVQRAGAGVVQEVDSAAMHLFARWQNMDLDEYELSGVPQATGDDWNLFQLGAIMFF